jgi:hypothetical protein
LEAGVLSGSMRAIIPSASTARIVKQRACGVAPCLLSRLVLNPPDSLADGDVGVHHRGSGQGRSAYFEGRSRVRLTLAAALPSVSALAVPAPSVVLSKMHHVAIRARRRFSRRSARASKEFLP